MPLPLAAATTLGPVSLPMVMVKDIAAQTEPVGVYAGTGILDFLILCYYNKTMSTPQLPVFLRWDETKRQANIDKHGLDFVDASMVLESVSPGRGQRASW